jgi:hypothetical protein
MIRSMTALAAAAALVAGCTPPESTDAAAETPVAEGAATDASAASDYAATIDAGWPAGQPVTPAEVEAMIEADGAQATVNALANNFEEPNRWQTVMRGIAMGDDDWLRIAGPIGEGTDAGTATEFGIALSDGLISNAEGVLGAVDTWSGHVQGVCMDNGIERTPEESAAFYSAAIAAVEAVQDTAPQAGVRLDTLRGEQAG